RPSGERDLLCARAAGHAVVAGPNAAVAVWPFAPTAPRRGAVFPTLWQLDRRANRAGGRRPRRHCQLELGARIDSGLAQADRSLAWGAWSVRASRHQFA